MIDQADFEKKQMLFVFTNNGDHLSFKNDNIVVKNRDGEVKHQSTCYRLFVLFVVGETTITSGLIRRAHKFGFTICLMTQSMKLYSVIGNRMEGNTLLHKRQYEYGDDELAIWIIHNKIANQRYALNTIRKKTTACKEAIQKMDEHITSIEEMKSSKSLLGIEGSAARTYFSQMFSNVNWKGRKPRIKYDYVNATLDIGYNLLFNLIDSLLQVYGFDVYYGVLHKSFYMRKSLVCDMVEPFRPIVDLSIRKAVNLGQCKEEDFKIMNKEWMLEYDNSKKYVSFLMEALLVYKKEIFLYVQSYYKNFMKQRPIDQYTPFLLENK